MGRVTRSTHDGEHGETTGCQQGVDDEVGIDRCGTPGSSGLDSQQQEAPVGDRRVGQHATDVGLQHGHRGTHHDAHPGQHGHCRRPVRGMSPEGNHEYPHHGGEPRRLHPGCHPRHHRTGRALVDVGRPSMERHCGHLEGQPHQQQGDASQQHSVLQKDHSGQMVGDEGQASRPGSPVEQGHAVEQERRGEGPQHEVLERRLLGLDAPQVQGGQHVHGDGQDLQS